MPCITGHWPDSRCCSPGCAAADSAMSDTIAARPAISASSRVSGTMSLARRSRRDERGTPEARKLRLGETCSSPTACRKDGFDCDRRPVNAEKEAASRNRRLQAGRHICRNWESADSRAARRMRRHAHCRAASPARSRGSRSRALPLRDASGSLHRRRAYIRFTSAMFASSGRSPPQPMACPSPSRATTKHAFGPRTSPGSNDERPLSPVMRASVADSSAISISAAAEAGSSKVISSM